MNKNSKKIAKKMKISEKPLNHSESHCCFCANNSFLYLTFLKIVINICIILRIHG